MFHTLLFLAASSPLSIPFFVFSISLLAIFPSRCSCCYLIPSYLVFLFSPYIFFFTFFFVFSLHSPPSLSSLFSSLLSPLLSLYFNTLQRQSFSCLSHRAPVLVHFFTLARSKLARWTRPLASPYLTTTLLLEPGHARLFLLLPFTSTLLFLPVLPIIPTSSSLLLFRRCTSDSSFRLVVFCLFILLFLYSLFSILLFASSYFLFPISYFLLLPLSPVSFSFLFLPLLCCFTLQSCLQQLVLGYFPRLPAASDFRLARCVLRFTACRPPCTPIRLALLCWGARGSPCDASSAFTYSGKAVYIVIPVSVPCTCILHPASCILHPASCILHLASLHLLATLFSVPHLVPQFLHRPKSLACAHAPNPIA